MFSKRKELEEKIKLLEEKLNLEKRDKEKELKKFLAEKELHLNEIQSLKQNITLVENTVSEKDLLIKDLQEKQRQLQDKGYQTLVGFKLAAPLLDKVLGRPFILTVAEEFNYAKSPDKKYFDHLLEAGAKIDGASFHNFRDEFKKDYSFKVTYSFSSKEYFLNTPDGKKSFQELMFPKGLENGLELNSNNKSAIYLAIKNKTLQSAVLPATVFGAPLLSYAFPINDEQGNPIGAVSFSNDITQIVQIAESLGDIVSSDSDAKLQNLAHVLKEELYSTEHSVLKVQEEAAISQKLASEIRLMGKEILDISEKLKVLALNTAIEATKIEGTGGKGINIIAQQMRNISENTRKTLKDIFEKNKELHHSSQNVIDVSKLVEASSTKLKQESSILLNTSTKITSQKDELATLVRMSIDEVAQNQDELNAIFMLIKNNKKVFR